MCDPTYLPDAVRGRKGHRCSSPPGPTRGLKDRLSYGWSRPSPSGPFGVSRHALASRSVVVRSRASALLLTFGPLSVPLQEFRPLAAQRPRRQVISSVGHPLGYSGFSGGGKGLPRGSIKVSPCHPRRFRSRACLPGRGDDPLCIPHLRGRAGVRGSAPRESRRLYIRRSRFAAGRL